MSANYIPQPPHSSLPGNSEGTVREVKRRGKRWYPHKQTPDVPGRSLGKDGQINVESETNEVIEDFEAFMARTVDEPIPESSGLATLDAEAEAYQRELERSAKGRIDVYLPRTPYVKAFESARSWRCEMTPVEYATSDWVCIACIADGKAKVIPADLDTKEKYFICPVNSNHLYYFRDNQTKPVHGWAVSDKAQKWVCLRCSGPTTENHRDVYVNLIVDRFCLHCLYGDRDKESDCIRVRAGPEWEHWKWDAGKSREQIYTEWLELLEWCHIE